MDKILQALYKGDLHPIEQYLPVTEEYKTACQKYHKHHEDFIAKIGSPLDKEFEAIMGEYFDISSMELSQMFIEGFWLGARMAIEIFEGENQKKATN